MFLNTTEDAWRFDIPLRGADPEHVTLDVAGNTICVRVDAPAGPGGAGSRYEQALALPACLDTGRLTASHGNGLLRLTVPLKDRRLDEATARPEPRVQRELELTAA